jgi:hypothetical protein
MLMPVLCAVDSHAPAEAWRLTCTVTRAASISLALAAALQIGVFAGAWWSFHAITSVSPVRAVDLMFDGQLGAGVYLRFVAAAVVLVVLWALLACQQVATIRLFYGLQAQDTLNGGGRDIVLGSGVSTRRAAGLPAPAAVSSDEQLFDASLVRQAEVAPRQVKRAAVGTQTAPISSAAAQAVAALQPTHDPPVATVDDLRPVAPLAVPAAHTSNPLDRLAAYAGPDSTRPS